MDSAKKEELDKLWKTIATKAVTDEAFKKTLTENPVGIMQENGLTLPEGSEMKVATGDVQKLVFPSDASDAIKEEVKWWEWRLDIIREFSKAEPKRTTGHLSMSAQEADDDDSGVF